MIACGCSLAMLKASDSVLYGNLISRPAGRVWCEVRVADGPLGRQRVLPGYGRGSDGRLDGTSRRPGVGDVVRCSRNNFLGGSKVAGDQVERWL